MPRLPRNLEVLIKDFSSLYSELSRAKSFLNLRPKRNSRDFFSTFLDFLSSSMSTQSGRILNNKDFLRSFKNTKNAFPIRETAALRYRITSFGSTPWPCFDFKTFCEADHNFKSGPKASAILAWAFMCSLSLFPFHLEFVLIAKSFLTKRSVFLIGMPLSFGKGKSFMRS